METWREQLVTSEQPAYTRLHRALEANAVKSGRPSGIPTQGAARETASGVTMERVLEHR